jgi:hypothetical protein
VTTISEAIESVTEEDVPEDQGQVVDDNGNVLEDDPDEGGGTLLDQPDDPEDDPDDDPDDPDADPDADTDDDPDADADADADDGDDLFDELTADEIAEAKANPVTNKIRRTLMRAYSKKTTEHSELVKLGNSYKSDPVGVLHAMAQSLNMKVTPAMEQAAEAKAAELKAGGTPAVDPNAEDPGKELEELFGEEIGPKVRGVFDKWAEARFGKAIAPVEASLKTVERERQVAVLVGADASFRAKHTDLTPAIEKEMIALGNSKKIVPGNLTPHEYLEVLHEVVVARHARKSTGKTQKSASTRLAKKIAANRRDREPEGQSGRGGTVKKVSKVANAKSISEALDIAMAELEEGER